MESDTTDADSTTGEGGWWHSIDLPSGRTKGHKSAEWLDQELASLDLPDLAGKSVLDIGAWDGFYTFTAERLRAARVVSLDYHVWAGVNVLERWVDYVAEGRGAYQDFWDMPGIFDLDGLPGRRNYDRAHRELESKAEPVVGDFMAMDLATLGTFDVVLFLGVLYHMKKPLLALERLLSITKEVAVIETEAVAGSGSYAEFLGGSDLNNDPTNWWIPTEEALVGLCRTAGFSRVEVKVSHPHRSPMHWRLGRRLRYLFNGRIETPPHYRAVVHAFP